MNPAPSEAVRTLREPATIRERCANITAAVEAGDSAWFRIDDSRCAYTARLVAELTLRQYPGLNVPYHSRWRHFEAGGIDLVQTLRGLIGPWQDEALARASLDLAVVSVLLDAGAGPDWSWQEPGGTIHTRSEGLGVASFHAFVNGAFSSERGKPLQVDARGLQRIDAPHLATLLQVSPDNPLLGLEGRAALLRRLGEALETQESAFGLFGGPARPGALFDLLAGKTQGSTIEAAELLRALLDHFSSVWLTPSRIDDTPLGDVWRHRRAGGRGDSAGWAPFHKLSQWLAYSLVEPFESAGFQVAGLDALTALPEYRNGGLLIDSGWLQLRDAARGPRSWQVGDELVIEWRALTVCLIDKLAESVRGLLKLDAQQLPLASLLQGGTWGTGRQLAMELRSGLPPLSIETDGTVF